MKKCNVSVFYLLIFFPAFCSIISYKCSGSSSSRSFQFPKSNFIENRAFRSNHSRPSFRDVELCQRLARCGSAREVLEILNPFVRNQTSCDLSNLSVVCLCTAIHRVAKDPSGGRKRSVTHSYGLIFDQLIRTVQSVLVHRKKDLECRHLANIAWAAARLNLGSRADLNGSGLFSLLEREAIQRIKLFR